VKSEKISQRNWVESSILKAYLNGNMSLKWILGVIRVANLVEKHDLEEIFSNLRKEYANNIKFQELEKACKQKGFL
jgi:hypothetical protein